MSETPTRRRADAQFLFRLLRDTTRQRPQAWRQLWISLLALSLSQSVLLLFTGPFLRFFLLPPAGNQLALGQLVPQLAAWPWAAGLTLSTANFAFLLPAVVGGLGLMRSGANYLYQLRAAHLALGWAQAYQLQAYRGMLGLDFMHLQQQSSSRWMALLLQDVYMLQQKASEWIGAFVRDVLLLVTSWLTLAWVSWPAALLLACVAPFIGWGVTRTGRKVSQVAAWFQAELAGMAEAVAVTRRRMPEIYAWGDQEREKLRLEKGIISYYLTLRRSFWVRFSFAPTLEFAGVLVFVFFAAAAGNLRLAAWVDPAQGVTFFAALGLLLRPMRSLGEQSSNLWQTLGALGPGLQVCRLAAPRRTHRSCPPVSLSLDVSRIQVRSLTGQNLVDAGPLKLAQGSCLLVTGPSGAGKSSLARALAGVYPAQVWQGTPDPLIWACGVAYCGQQPLVFEGTLRDNLVYGLGISPSDSELIAVCRTLGLDFSAVGGLDTGLHPLTAPLSGGQVARIAVARCLLSPLPVWIFDEATAALDESRHRNISDKVLATARERGKTLVWMTHRVHRPQAFDHHWQVIAGRLRTTGEEVCDR